MFKRRDFLNLSKGAVIAMATSVKTFFGSSKTKRPNIVVVMTDQQYADCMSHVMGNKYIHTPHMDSLAENGVSFKKAYSPTPLCTPMRTSMIYGRYPHQLNVVSNKSPKNVYPDSTVSLGKLFKNAGYKTAYYGKFHVRMEKGGKNPSISGFQTFTKDGHLSGTPASDFIKNNENMP